MQTNLQPAIKYLFKKSWVQHVTFWVALVALFTLFRTIRSDEMISSWRTLVFEIIPFSGVASAVYLNQAILLPRYLSAKRYGIYVVALLGITLANAFFVFLLFGALEPLFVEIGHGPHPNRWMFFPAYITMQLIFVSFTSFFHFVRENNRLNEIALSITELESNRLKAELNSLKAQINPHFLFNTLNNIYSYSLFESEKTPEMILKLSDLMNYIIYECQAEQIALSKEVAFFHNYLALEKLRVEESLTISTNIQEGNDDFKIAPLLFIPFLENAFKHGANVQIKDPYIRIYFAVDQSGKLHFECENLQDEQIHDDLPEKPGGIGLENVKKRLELLYPQNYDLNIEEGSGTYKVMLTIQLENS